MKLEDALKIKETEDSVRRYNKRLAYRDIVENTLASSEEKWIEVSQCTQNTLAGINEEYRWNPMLTIFITLVSVISLCTTFNLGALIVLLICTCVILYRIVEYIIDEFFSFKTVFTDTEVYRYVSRRALLRWRCKL